MENSGKFFLKSQESHGIFVAYSSLYWAFLFALYVKNKYMQPLSVIKNMFQGNISVWMYLAIAFS